MLNMLSMSNSGDNTLSSIVSLELVNMWWFLHHQCSADTVHWASQGGALPFSVLCKPIHFYLSTINVLFLPMEGRRKLRNNKRRGKLPDSSLHYCWEVQGKKKKKKKELGGAGHSEEQESRKEKKKDLTGRRN